jgi:protein-disulfide reductase (glutathione)
LGVVACLVTAAGFAVKDGMPLAPAKAAAKVLEWNEKEIRWHSYADGLREARRSGKPILVVFYTDWCPHCRATTALFRDDEIITLSRELVMVKVNQDRDPEISARYAPDGLYIPRTMILKPNGELAAKIHGGNPTYRYFLDYKSTREFAGVMKRAAAVR